MGRFITTIMAIVVVTLYAAILFLFLSDSQQCECEKKGGTEARTTLRHVCVKLEFV